MNNQGNTLLNLLPGNVNEGVMKSVSRSSGKTEGWSSEDKFDNDFSGVFKDSVDAVSKKSISEIKYNSTDSGTPINKILLGNSCFNIAELNPVSECSLNNQTGEPLMDSNITLLKTVDLDYEPIENIEKLLALSGNNESNNNSAFPTKIDLSIPENLSTFGIYNSLKADQLNFPDITVVESGRYEIVDSSINNGEINLSLKNSGGSSNNIKITLPIDQFKECIQNGSNNINRVPLDGQNGKLVELAGIEDYFSKLNLKELAESDGYKFRIFMLGEASGVKKTDVAIEDLFPDDFFRECVNRAYGVAIRNEDLPVDGSTLISKRVETVLKERHGKELDKKTVLTEVLREFDSWTKISDLPKGTAASAEKLFKSINTAFKLAQA